MYEVENIPYARKSSAESLLSRFSFEKLAVGQSFFVPNGDGERATPIPVNVANTSLAPAQFKVREEVHADTGVAGRRVYRIADVGTVAAAEDAAAE